LWYNILHFYKVDFKPMTFWPIVLEGVNIALYMLQMYLMYKALSLSTVSKLQPIEFTKFGFAVIFSYFLLGEAIVMKEIIAAGLIFAANFYLMKKHIN